MKAKEATSNNLLKKLYVFTNNKSVKVFLIELS